MEKHNQKVDKYESMLSSTEKEAVEEYLEVLAELQGAESEFIYQQGFRGVLNNVIFATKECGFEGIF